MNKNLFAGQWKEFKGKVKEQWAKLTDDDIAQVEGRRDRLLGVLQQRYGYLKERAEEELKKWEKECERCTKQNPPKARR